VYAKPAHSWGNQLKAYQGITNKISKRDYSQRMCISPWSTMVVKVNGDVPLCPMDFKCTKRMGNINESSVRKIWNSDGLILIRKRLMAGKRNSIALCKNCYLWDKDTIIENKKLGLNTNREESTHEN
jgi:radical SAM protein with 4Fe4S-binding SPASM domain